MNHLLLVACGGAIGAVSRYAVGVWTVRLWGGGFPWGTLIVNVAGCLLLGALDAATRDNESLATVRAAVGVGLLGALTTFSTFGVETLRAFEAGRWGIALSSVLLNLVVGLTAAWLGSWLVKSLS